MASFRSPPRETPSISLPSTAPTVSSETNLVKCSRSRNPWIIVFIRSAKLPISSSDFTDAVTVKSPLPILSAAAPMIISGWMTTSFMNILRVIPTINTVKIPTPTEAYRFRSISSRTGFIEVETFILLLTFHMSFSITKSGSSGLGGL